jgi:hypothetical protein
MQDQETNWKGRVVVIIFVTAVLAVAGWYGYQYMESKLAGTKEERSAEISPSQPVKEQSGVATESVPATDEKSAKENIAKNIQRIFAERYDRDIADIAVVADQFSEQYARGGANIGPLGDDANAVWFAAMSEGKWKLAVHTASHDGEFFCDHIKQYSFPAEFTGDCIQAIAITAKEKEQFGLVQFTKEASHYEWDVKYDKTLLRLDKRTSVPWNSARPGDGADETFTFTPLKKGEATLVFSLVKTEQDMGPLDEQYYIVTIE